MHDEIIGGIQLAQLGTIYETKAQTAKKIRQALKKAFPSCPARHFSVRCGTGGSDTVNISWKGAPEQKEVDAITKKFQSASFDGMQDSETIHGYIWEEDGLKYSGAKYIFTNQQPADEVEEVTQEAFEEAVEQVSVEEEITLFNKDGDTIGSYNLKGFVEKVSEIWKAKYNEAVEFHASFNKEGEFTLVAGMGTPRSSLIRQMGINLDTEGILKALGGMSITGTDSQGRETTVVTDHYKFRGWKNQAFGSGMELFNLPDSVKITKNGSVIREFYSLSEMQAFLESKAKEAFGDARLQFGVVVSSGKLLMTGRTDESQLAMTQIGITDDGSVGTTNGILHSLGLIAQFAGREYGKAGSKGTKAPQERYATEYVAKIEEFGRDNISKILPKYLQYPNAGREIIKHAKSLASYKAGFVNAMVSGDSQGASQIIVTALSDGVNKYAEGLIKEYEEHLKTEAKMVDTAYSKNKFFSGNDFILFLGTDIKATLQEIAKYRMLNHTRFRQTTAEFFDAKFEEYKKQVEKNQEEEQRKQEEQAQAKADPNQMFTDAEIEEADDVKVTPADVVMVRQQIDIVLQQKQFEGYVVSRGGVMKLVKVPVIEELKKAHSTDYRNFTDAVRNHLAEVVDHNFEKIDNLAGHVDPREISGKEMIRILRDKVVRVHFRKKDGSLRNMVATRNAELIEKIVAVKNGKAYERPKALSDMAEKDQIQAQISGDYIKVLDVAKGEFRTFKPSTIQRFDANVNVGSWLEFDIAEDGWFDVVFNGANPSNYYDYHRNAKETGVRLAERKEFEAKAHAILHPEEQSAQTEVAVTRESKAEACKKWANQYLASIKDKNFDDNYENLYVSLGTVVNGINNIPQVSQRGWVAKVAQEMPELKFRIVQVGGEALMVHPHFLVNIVSGKVYVDKSDTLRLGHANPSEVDAVIGDFLTRVAGVIQGTRRSTRQNAPATEADGKRMNRLRQFVEVQKETLQQANVRINFGNSNGKELAVFLFGQQQMFVAPSEIVVKPSNGEPKQVFKRVRHTSTLTEMSEVLNKIQIGTNPKEQQQYEFVKKVIYLTFDLRKQIS